MNLKIISSIEEIKKETWNNLTDPNFPFCDYDFYLGLEKSHCVGEKAGQLPLYFTLWEEDHLLAGTVVYLKNHSYGEYIFDWGWADAYARYGVDYYPKLMLYSPFTPAVGNKVLANSDASKSLLIQKILEFSQIKKLSSFHALFITEEERKLFANENLKERHSLQYHFKNNDYEDFNSFLMTLKMRKRKAILKERQKIKNEHIHIELIENDSLIEFSKIFYSFYLKTIDKKYGMAYLNLEFFEYIFLNLKDQVKLFVAKRSENIVAMSLCFHKGNKLYGRYWGGYDEFPYLHFELCYYSPIEYVIKNKIKIFEAGAQGEHKNARGFDPVLIKSFHEVYDLNFKTAIDNFIDEEKKQIDEVLKDLMLESAFKS